MTSSLSAMHRETAERFGLRAEFLFKHQGRYHELSWSECRKNADAAAAALWKWGSHSAIAL